MGAQRVYPSGFYFMQIFGFDTLNLSKNILAFDTETTGLHPYYTVKHHGFYGARPFAFSFCDYFGNRAYLRFEVNPKNRKVIFLKKGIDILKTFLCDEKINKVCHNLSFDHSMCDFSHIELKGKLYDTNFMWHTISGGSFLSYRLKDLAFKIAGIPNDDEKALEDSAKEARKKAKQKGWCVASSEFFGDKSHRADYWLADRKLCRKYAEIDAERTMLLYISGREHIRKNANFSRVFSRECQMYWVIRSIERRGVRLLPARQKKIFEYYEKYKKTQLKICNENGGKGLNFRSPKQKQQIFFIDRGYKPSPKAFTKTGAPKTDGDALQYISDKYKDPLAKAILEYNAADSMVTNFLQPYERYKSFESPYQILHPNFKQTGAKTGRMSCTSPNLLNVASDDSGRKVASLNLRIRELLGPRKGYLWYLPDYSQIEVWVFSFLAKDPIMMNALLSGEDFHRAISKQVWGSESDFGEKADHYRKRSKLLMFCKLYGGGVGKVATLLDASEEEARQFIFDYNERLPGVQEFMDRIITEAQVNGKLVNPFGRTYFIDPGFEYKGVNYLVQGTSADLFKRAMISIHKYFTRKNLDCHIINAVHDEIPMEISESLHCKNLMRKIVSLMQKDHGVIGCPIPLPVGMKIAKVRWSNTESIDFIKKEWTIKYVKNSRRDFGKTKRIHDLRNRLRTSVRR